MNAGFVSLDYTAEEGTGLLEVCLEVFGSNSLSQSSLVRVQTIPGTAQGDYCTIHLTYLIIEAIMTLLFFPVTALT